MDRRVERKVEDLERGGAQCWIEGGVPLGGSLYDDVVLCDPSTLRNPPAAIVNQGWAAFVPTGAEKRRGHIAPAATGDVPGQPMSHRTRVAVVGGLLVTLCAVGTWLARRGM